jgi:AcrR family transcriptional regulator
MMAVVAELTAKGRATRERIVAAAAGLMLADGVAATSTEDVQRAAGASPSQLYHYFGDRKSLIRAVIADLTDSVLSFQAPLLLQLDSIEALEAWRDELVCRQLDRHSAGGCPIGSLVGQLAEVDPDARADLAAGLSRWETAIRDGLERMRTRGELRPDADTARLALFLLAAVQGGLLLTQARRDATALRTALDVAIDHIRSQQVA